MLTVEPPRPVSWYQNVTKYQWTVLIIASVGWMFDAFEGQIFVASMTRAMGDLLGAKATVGDKAFYNNIAFASFLLGGATGGLLFGSLADRIGRQRTMIYTILMYSLFTGLTFFARNWWDLAILRFFVAMGVGGEWAVAAAAVAEVFPEQRSRTSALGIFHASSVLGTMMAIAAGATIVVLNWRYGFLLGFLPSLLTLWVRRKLKDPEKWELAREIAKNDRSRRLGNFTDLFSTPQLRRNTLVATGLAAIGMATFWGVHVYGKDLLREAVTARYLSLELAQNPAASLETVVSAHRTSIQRWEMLGMFLTTLGGGLGLLGFAPISQRTSRKQAFLFYYLGAFLVVLVTCLLVHGITPVIIALPLFGFLTMGMHAGFAVYFPELFPTRMRASGGGFCFNIARVIAAPALLLSGAVQKEDLGRLLSPTFLQNMKAWGAVAIDAASGTQTYHLTLRASVILLGLLYFLGLGLLAWAPETRNQPLPE